LGFRAVNPGVEVEAVDGFAGVGEEPGNVAECGFVFEAGETGVEGEAPDTEVSAERVFRGGNGRRHGRFEI
jgi:hypothetical protein